MHVRCPQCSNPVDLAPADSLTDIECPSCGSHFHLVSPESTTRDDRPFQMAHFRLLDQVGFGRFGTVWKARDEELDRTVAIKMPRREELGPAESEQFMREARAAAQLQHPNIVSVHEVGRCEDRLYIVSDFVDGPNLSEWLSGQRLTAREAAEMCVALADALHHAHEAGVVHRDLKPGNVLLDRTGKPYVADFGLAKREFGEVTVTVDGKVLGTPAYMPPEQARGEGHSADRRSDVYSLGVILYELLTGQRPFRGEKRMLIHQILNEEPTPPRRLSSLVPRDLETICLKCMEKDPGRRYPTAAELADDLRRYLAGKPITARPISGRERLVRWSRRNPAVAGLIAAIMAVLLGAVVVSTFFAFRAGIDRDAATAALYRGLVRELQLSRQARQEGYFENVRDLAQRAISLDTSERDIDEIRREVIKAMGDFVGYKPVIFNDFPAETREIALSPDGSELAVADADGSISIFETSKKGSRELLELLQRHDTEVWALEYSRDGRQLVSADRGGHVQIWTRVRSGWRPTTSFEVGPFKEPEEGPSHRLELSQDGELLVVLEGADVRVWDVQEGTQTQFPTESNWVMRSAAISPSGRRLAAGFNVQGTDNYGWAVWDLETPKRLTSKILNVGATYQSGIAFSGDSKQLAVGFDEALVVYKKVDNSDRFEQQMFKRLDATTAVAFAPDKPYLAAVDIRGVITVWNIHTGREIATLEHWGQPGNTRITFSADGRRLAAGNAVAVSVWDLTAADERLVLAGHPAPIPCAAFSPEGRQLVSGGKDGVVNFWNPDTGQPIDSVPVSGPVQVVTYSQDGSILAIGSWSRGESPPRITLVDPITREELGSEPSEIGNVNGLALIKSDDERYLAACGEKGFALYTVHRNKDNGRIELQQKERQTRHGSAQMALHLAATRNGRWIAIAWYDRATRNYEVALWDVQNAKPVDLQAPLMYQGWHGLAFLPDNQRVVYVAKSGVGQIWDVIDENDEDTEIGKIAPLKAPQIAATRDGPWLAALTVPDTVSVWNTETSVLEYLFRPEGSSVWALAWTPNGQNLAVGRTDGGLAIWKLQRIDKKLDAMGLGKSVRQD